MKAPQDIILAPVITEASTLGIADKKYTFYVAKSANKIEIAQAVEKLFGVQVAKVNTTVVPGKYKRMGQHGGYRPDRKKAFVTLKAGSKAIEFFESMM